MGSAIKMPACFRPAYTLVAVDSDVDTERGDDEDINETVDRDEQEHITNCQLLSLIINTITIRPCGRFIILFQAYLQEELNFSITDIAYISTAASVGSTVTFLFPILLSKLNTNSGYFRHSISYRFVLSYLHTMAGLIVLSYTVFDSLLYYIVTRFVFGVLVNLFSSYKNTYIAQFSKSKEDWMINYALVYLAWPLTIVYLIGFGFLLYYTTYVYSVVFLSVPLILTSLYLFVSLPARSIDEVNSNSNDNIGSFSDYVSVLMNMNRGLKMLIGFFGGMKMCMFTLVLSSWFKEYFHLNAATYYSVLLVQAAAEFAGIFLTIVYKKYKNRYRNAHRGQFDSSAVFLYTLSKFIGATVFALIYLSETVHLTIPYEMALVLTGFMYFGSILRNTCGGTLNMQLIQDKPEKRAMFNSCKRSCIAMGRICGSFVAAYMYSYDGMKTVSLVGMSVCAISSVSCCVLWYNMKRQNIVP